MSEKVEEYKEEVSNYVDQMADTLESLAKKIYDNPEEKFEEYQAVEWLSEELENQGFEVEREVAGLETAFRAVSPQSSDGPAIGYLCEYDALPGLGHACGHNLIAAIGLGAGVALSGLLDKLDGRVEIIGTPAEEGGGGKVDLAEAGVFDDLDAAMMVHPSDKTKVGRGSLAIKQVNMDFYGESAHSSAEPEKGINALDAAINTFNNINAYREHMDEKSRVHGIITDGGEKPNIVPDHAGVEFYVRVADQEDLDDLLQRVLDCGKAGALAAGAEFEYCVTGHAYKAMDPNPVLVDLYSSNLEKLNEEISEHEGGMGSTDMGDVSQAVPAIHPYIKIAEDGTPGHSKAFLEAADSEQGYQGMVTAAKALAMTGVDLLANPDLVEEAWEAFEGSE
ncbi:MAG: M20 family metallopeptidase [Candidatus Bipolaricaulota bacterium]